MKQFKLLMAIILSLLTWSCNPTDLSGGQTTNQATIGITVYRPDGVTPASGATLKLFTPNSDTGGLIDQRELDENGQYDPSLLTLSATSPYHNMVIEYASTEAIFNDSVFITKENLTYLKDDTLAPVGSISGVVAIQPNRERIRVLIRVLGTDIFTKADSLSGEFLIGGLGEGEYNLMFTCEYENYGVALFDTVATSGDTTIIVDTIDIPYLGIPVVEGISSIYDTLNATATISWENTNYAEFATYELFRTTDVTDWPENALVHVTDTSYTDIQKTFGSDSVYYRVRILNKTNESGPEYNQTAILPVSPEEARTVFTSSLFHIKKQKVTTACSINDSMTVHFGFYNPSRTFSSLSVSEWESDKSFDTPVSSFSDSLSLFVIEDTTIVITATDGHGDVWSDTIVIDVVEDAPVIISVDSVVSLNVLDTIRAVVSDEYGEIVKYEWDLDGDGVFEKEAVVPFIEVKMDTIILSQAITMKVIDTDQNEVLINSQIRTEFHWQKIGDLPADLIFSEQDFFVFQNQLARMDTKGFIWSSIDGVNWSKRGGLSKPDDGSYSAKCFQNYFTYNGRAWGLISHAQGAFGSYVSSLWSSDDLDNWGLVYQSEEIFYPHNTSHPMIFPTPSGIYGTLQPTKDVSKPQKSLNGVDWETYSTDVHFGLVASNTTMYESVGDEIYGITADGRNIMFIATYTDDFSRKSSAYCSLVNGVTAIGSYTRSCVYKQNLIIASKEQFYLFSPSTQSLHALGNLPTSINYDSWAEYPYIVTFKENVYVISLNGEVWKAD